MTAEEMYGRFQIPEKVLKEYQDWGLCDAVRMRMDDWQYTDLEWLGMIMALHDIGFGKSEVEQYVKLLQNADETKMERMEMLNHLRSRVLDDIHLKERQMVRMDYLRNEIRDSFKEKQPEGEENGIYNT